MSGNRGARRGVEVRSGHSSVPSALLDSKGLMVSGRPLYLRCQPRFGAGPCVWYLSSSDREGAPPAPDFFLLAAISVYTVLGALFLVGCVAKTRFLSSLSQDLGVLNRPEPLSVHSVNLLLTSHITECLLQLLSQGAVRG